MILGARWAKNIAVGQLHRFVLDGAENVLGQALRLRPYSAAVGGRHDEPPPSWHIGADFVKEHQRPVFGLEQHGIPARIAFCGRFNAVGHLARRGPLTLFTSRQPNANVRVFFLGAAKPRGDQFAARFGDGRGVAFGERGFFENEFVCDDARLFRPVGSEDDCRNHGRENRKQPACINLFCKLHCQILQTYHTASGGITG